MNNKELKFKNPRLETINLELKRYSRYVPTRFNKKKVELDFNFEVYMKSDKLIEFFVHIQYGYKIKKNELFPCYHSDHILSIELEKDNKQRKFETQFIAHLLGTGIVMIKGYFDTITFGHEINKIPLPVFSPLEMINTKYEKEIKNGVIKLLKR